MATLQLAGNGHTITLEVQINWILQSETELLARQEITCYSDTPEAARAAIETLNRIFENARQARYNESWPRSYANFTPYTGSIVWRSEIYDGLAEPNIESVHDSEPAGQGCVYRWRFSFEHRAEWEGPETPIALTAPGVSTPTTSPITIANNNLGYVVIAANQIAGGEVSSPIKLRVTVNSAGASATNLYVGLNRRPFDSAPIVLDTANATQNGGYNIGTFSSATYLGGSAIQYQWTSTTEVILMYWDVSGSLLVNTRGMPLVPILRTQPAPAGDYQFRLVIRQGLTPYVFGEWTEINAGGELHQLFPVNLPSRYLDATSLPTLRVELQARRPSGAQGNIAIDYLYLGARDAFKRYTAIANAAVNGQTIVDDPYERVLAMEYSSGDRIGNYEAFGAEEFLLASNEPAVLHFLMAGTSNTTSVQWQMTVQASYRPRKRAVL